ncbi:UvrD-helicase domain-containing protein [Paenibacillus sp. JX-17]|uniref:DNA 3'-5' helicase n=1 Tax=Paenibacillus lacisoli TaxID=3064525 RepID=A0ABT9CBM9_9BACL|nr:UvrD-helicase domain-containing protein [Paenibacillus sp. JX-17]MDO7906661.1 UvrD-helicase domain-containing protein [Paenibacillus sp. JX-17]
MSNHYTDFHPRPAGVPLATPAPAAKPAPAATSSRLVLDSEADAYYFRALEREGIHLNQPQIAAVRHGQGPLLTLAGAGCGKTTVLAARAGYLMAVREVPASTILLMTFTSKAAAEMKARIAALPGIRPAAARTVQARTFHSFALAMLRHHGATEDIFGDMQAQHTIMKMLQRQLGLSDVFQPESLLSALSAWKAGGRTTDELPEQTPDEKDAKRLLLAYEQWKQERNKMDFDDILLRAAALMKDPQILGTLRRRFRYLMVDEFQDTNTLQYDMVRMLADEHRNLMVVGDDDQTIYTFNGARQESILEFDRVYPGAKVITLNQNYRSDARILGLGSSLVEHNRLRRRKKLLAAGQQGYPPQFSAPAGTEEEAAQVVSHLLRQVEAGELAYRDIAILHRTASSSRSIFEHLILRDVPFIQYGTGPVFYDQSLIRPLMDHLRLSLEPRRMDALASALGPLYVPREAGLDYILREEKKQAKKYPLIHLTRWDKLRDFQQEQVKGRIRLIKSLQTMKPVLAIQEMRRQFYDKYMEAGDPSILTHYKETMLETLEELESAAKRFDTVADFISFADELTRRHKEMESLRMSEDSDAVRLMTIHRAKGLEFPCVYWIGASEGILPHSTALKQDVPDDRKPVFGSAAEGADAALEEERRLAYVAVTRAKQKLYITSPATVHGKPAPVSRFITEAYGILPEAASKPAADQPLRERNNRESSRSFAITSARSQGNRRSHTVTIRQNADGGRTAPARTAPRAGRTEHVPVWTCTAASCKAWIRQAAAGRRAHGSSTSASPPACPLCGSRMEGGSREVPV